MADVKQQIELSLLGPIRNPELMKAYKVSARGGLLLYGPPGCGKTFIAKAISGELGSNFYQVGIADVMHQWFGESERSIRSIFDSARRNAPCVLFFDEVDALGHRRSGLSSYQGLRTIVNTLLEEMDSATNGNDGVYVLGATNAPWEVDTALRRPGRFDTG
jgi:SpoVK/Ycf46/Vps4 family AAA+-type ATPase